jgi:hypothetical protein
MFSLAFLEWFTLVLAIGHLISPLVFIEVKVIQLSVFRVVQNCICYVFYSVLFFRTGKIFFCLTRFSCLSVRMTDNFSASFGKSDIYSQTCLKGHLRTDRHENLVRQKNILPVRKKSPKKFTVTCIMFSLAFLEWFTLVLAIGTKPICEDDHDTVGYLYIYQPMTWRLSYNHWPKIRNV